MKPFETYPNSLSIFRGMIVSMSLDEESSVVFATIFVFRVMAHAESRSIYRVTDDRIDDIAARRTMRIPAVERRSASVRKTVNRWRENICEVLRSGWTVFEKSRKLGAFAIHSGRGASRCARPPSVRV